MELKYHKSISDDGGLIGDEIFSGDVNGLFPEISKAQQLSGATISRKFYISNITGNDIPISSLSVSNSSVFSAILFESSGDAQVVGDLTGSEVDESPISVIIPANSHKSFWIKLYVPIGSTVSKNFGLIDIKQIKG